MKIGAKSRKFRAQMFRQLYSICVVTGEIRLNGLFFSKKASKKCDLWKRSVFFVGEKFVAQKFFGQVGNLLKNPSHPQNLPAPTLMVCSIHGHQLWALLFHCKIVEGRQSPLLRFAHDWSWCLVEQSRPCAASSSHWWVTVAECSDRKRILTRRVRWWPIKNGRKCPVPAKTSNRLPGFRSMVNRKPTIPLSRKVNVKVQKVKNHRRRNRSSRPSWVSFPKSRNCNLVLHFRRKEPTLFTLQICGVPRRVCNVLKQTKTGDVESALNAVHMSRLPYLSKERDLNCDVTAFGADKQTLMHVLLSVDDSNVFSCMATTGQQTSHDKQTCGSVCLFKPAKPHSTTKSIFRCCLQIAFEVFELYQLRKHEESHRTRARWRKQTRGVTHDSS